MCIDSSTIDPAVSKKIAAMAAEKGAGFVDAPVSGGRCSCSRLCHIRGGVMVVVVVYIYMCVCVCVCGGGVRVSEPVGSCIIKVWRCVEHGLVLCGCSGILFPTALRT